MHHAGRSNGQAEKDRHLVRQGGDEPPERYRMA